MKIRTYCDLDSTLSVETSNIDNWGDYIEYLNDILFRRLCDKDEKVTFKSERFGNLDIIVGLDQFFQDRDGKAEVMINIFTKDENITYNEDEWYEHMNEDIVLIETIERMIKTFVEKVNASIKDIKYPKNETLIFKDGHYYMEINPNCPNHVPEYISLRVENDINRDNLIYNLLVQE